MVVSKQLSKQIIIEIFALLFLIAVIVYAIFAIDKNNSNNISSQDGMVIVLDNKNVSKLTVLSDGQGLETEGILYNLTNNNSSEKKYKIILFPSIQESNVLDQIKIGVDDLYIDELTKLERHNGGYVVASGNLKAGYTNRHLFKFWYKLDTKEELVKEVEFDFKLVIE